MRSNTEIYRNYKEEDILLVSEWLWQMGKEYNIWLFYGEMGSGKTTLIKGICNWLKVKDTVHSPTFSLVNEYRTETNETIYHFDFYRLKNEIEVVNIGIDEYFYSDSLCLVEWPEKIPSFLPSDRVEIVISINNDQSRNLEIIKP